MVLKILLIIAIILQLVAVSIAIGLTRKTKYNLSWMLFTVALSCMAFLRFDEYFEVAGLVDLKIPRLLMVWLGVITSLCFAVGVFLVQKIFKYIYVSEQQRRLSERRIFHTVIRTEEAERQRFSRDLHDGLGPLLSSARMSLSALDITGIDPRNKEIIQNTNMVIDEAVRSLKEISANMSPHILNDFGLARAITSFINKMFSGGTVTVDFKTNLRGERFDPDIEIIIYRVICEFLNNSLKHSEASRIDVNVDKSSDRLHVYYKDNGKGFILDEHKFNGMGLSNITSRINSLKGELSVSSVLGEGMEAKIDIEIK